MKVYTMKDLQKILKMSEPTIRALIKDGKLKKLDTHKAVRVSEEQLKMYLKGE